MTKRALQFFATREDLETVFEAVDQAVPVKCVRTGLHTTSKQEEYAGVIKIPNLGRATCESSGGSASYLVVPRDGTVHVRVIDSRVGKRYAIDQLANPNSVFLNPGGLWGEDVLLHGTVGTVHDDPESQALLKHFTREIRRKPFNKIGPYWVGPNALALLRAGKRLTIAEQSPREFDLSEG